MPAREPHYPQSPTTAYHHLKRHRFAPCLFSSLPRFRSAGQAGEAVAWEYRADVQRGGGGEKKVSKLLKNRHNPPGRNISCAAARPLLLLLLLLSPLMCKSGDEMETCLVRLLFSSDQQDPCAAAPRLEMIPLHQICHFLSARLALFISDL